MGIAEGSGGGYRTVEGITDGAKGLHVLPCPSHPPPPHVDPFSLSFPSPLPHAPHYVLQPFPPPFAL